MTATLTPSDTRTGLTTVSVPLSQFQDALAWVAPCAATGSGFGNVAWMHAVEVRIANGGSHAPHYGKQWEHVSTAGRAVSFAATDRYRLGWATLQASSEGEHESGDTGEATFLIDAKALVTAARSLPKAKRGSVFTVRVTFDAQLHTATLDVFDRGVTVGSVMLPTVDTHDATSFPKYESLVPDVTLPDYTAEAFHVNAAFVADFAKAAVKVHKSGTMRIAPRSSKACAVATAWVDDHAPRFSAILMPIRMPR